MVVVEEIARVIVNKNSTSVGVRNRISDSGNDSNRNSDE